MLTARKCVHKIYQIHPGDSAHEEDPVSEIGLFDLEKSFRGRQRYPHIYFQHPREFHLSR